jgi:hypothetical protein
MKLPRFTMRRLMVVVAIVAGLLALTPVAFRFLDPDTHFHNFYFGPPDPK